jgi:hypothetical protein
MIRLKPNKKQWIYGARAGGKIHYPPVVPHIPPELQARIVEMFVRAASQESQALRRRQAGLRDTIGALEAHVVLSAVDRRRLHQARQELEKVRGQLAGIEARLARQARTEALNLCLIRGLRQVEVVEDFEGRPNLKIVTSPIKIGRALLGTYDVIVNPFHDVPSNVIDIVRRDYVSRTGPHPHWNNGPCFGTWGPMLHTMIRQKRWSAVVGGMLNYLAIYYGRSPLIDLETFYPGGAYENRTPTV